jgi:outer membrane protein OmpA-like peptidoglycan-associated protein
MKVSHFALVVALGATVSFAVKAEQYFKGKPVEKDAIVEALTPGEEVAPPQVKMRSIKVLSDEQKAPAKPGQAAASVKKASASLLITFQTNSAELSASAKSSLDVVAQALQADKLANFRFSVEGHADPRGHSEDNLKLSQARAESVVNYLVSRSISRERLQAVGKGDTELASPQRPAAAENRRVTIKTLRD